MNGKLQQAIEAARSGESQKAQVLLAQILKDDTKNVHAWFLLSHLVESKEKKVAFLKKVLDLDPTHQKAQERLAELMPTKTEPMVVETAVLPAPEDQPTPVIFAEPDNDAHFQQDEEDLFAEEDEDDDLPAWLSEDSGDLISPEALAAEALPEFSDTVDAEDLPDWLTKTNIDDWTAEKPWEQAENLFDDIEFEDDEDNAVIEEEKGPAPVAVKSVIDVARELQEPDPPPLAPEKSLKVKNDSWLNRVLLFLIVIAAVVLILLLYIVITSLG